MLARRIIPCLDVAGGRVVKGVHFQSLRDAGDPVVQAARYDAEGADELVFLDISASHEARATTLDMVSKVAEAIFIPFKSRAMRVAALAAMVILCFGLGYLMNRPTPPLPVSTEPIVLASQPGQMTDDKFLALTRELLTADPEYHQKMYMILSSLNREERQWPLEVMPRNEGPSSVEAVTADGGGTRQTYRF